mgnify:FL=1
MSDLQAAIADLEEKGFQIVGPNSVLDQTPLKPSKPVWLVRNGIGERIRLMILSDTDLCGIPPVLIETETDEPTYRAVSSCGLEGLLENLHWKEPTSLIDADPEEIVRRPKKLIRYLRQRLDCETWLAMSKKQRLEFAIGSHGIREIATLLGVKYFSHNRRADHLRLARAIYEELPKHV